MAGISPFHNLSRLILSRKEITEKKKILKFSGMRRVTFFG
jgi:hypothetical protein